MANGKVNIPYMDAMGTIKIDNTGNGFHGFFIQLLLEVPDCCG